MYHCFLWKILLKTFCDWGRKKGAWNKLILYCAVFGQILCNFNTTGRFWRTCDHKGFNGCMAIQTPPTKKKKKLKKMMHSDAAPSVGAVATLKVSLEFVSFDNNFDLAWRRACVTVPSQVKCSKHALHWMTGNSSVQASEEEQEELYLSSSMRWKIRCLAALSLSGHHTPRMLIRCGMRQLQTLDSRSVCVCMLMPQLHLTFFPIRFFGGFPD